MTRARSLTRRGPRHVLDVVQVGVSFGAVQALESVSLSVRQGAFVGLIGPNGAGKTTCFNVISGFAQPSSGWVRFDGRRITDWPSSRRARAGIARTFQNIGLDKKASVLDNLRVANEGGQPFAAPLLQGRSRDPEDSRLLMDLLDRLQLRGILRERVDKLPIGSAKLVEVACALARAPRLLLLDEPSSGLGPTERILLKDFLREYHSESRVSILMIEHDMDLAMSLVDYVYVLNFGTSLSEGTPDEIQRDPRVIEAYLGGAA